MPIIIKPIKKKKSPVLPGQKILMHFEGANNSTTFTESISNQSVTTVGTPFLTNIWSKFGSTSIRFNGRPNSSNIHKITTQASGDNIIAGAFTVDLWVKPDHTGGEFWYHPPCVLCCDGGYPTGIEFFAGYEISARYGGRIMGTEFKFDVPSPQTEHHIAITRDNSNVIRVFLDGIQKGSFTNSSVINPSGTGFTLGGSTRHSSYNYNGNLDEFNFINGYATWVSNFTPPTAPY